MSMISAISPDLHLPVPTAPARPSPTIRPATLAAPAAAAARLAKAAAGTLLALLLAACASSPPATPGKAGPARARPDTVVLNVDRTHTAKSQSSRVDFLVMHYTSADKDRSLYLLTERNVSAHYLVTDDPQPQVYQLVDESRRAWHAGAANWYGRTDINAGSIGIEIVNAGGEGPEGSQYWAPYSPAQMRVVAALMHDIVERHQIKPANIVGHSDVAPQRKIDPGPLFPWRELAKEGLGRWYDEEAARASAEQFRRQGLPDMHWVQSALARLGYQTPRTGTLDRATQKVIRAFQMHYRPSLYDGQPDAETLGIMQAMR